MMRVNKSLLTVFACLSLGGLVTSGFAQADFKKSSPPKSLDEVAQSQLQNPSVRLELHLDRTQEFKAIENQVKQILNMIGRASFHATSEEEPLKSFTVKAEDLNDLGFKLAFADLYPNQQRRVRQIALQQSPASCLMTSDLQLALQLSGTQVQQLQKLWEQNQNRMFMKAKPIADACGKKMESLMKSMVKEDQAPSEELFHQVVDKIVPVFMEMYEKIEKAGLGSTLDQQALQVLTSSQRKRLKELQGKPFAWKPNL